MGFLRRLFGRSAPTETNSTVTYPSNPSDPSDPRESWYVAGDADPQRFIAPGGGPPPLHLIDYRTAAGEAVLRLCEDSTGLLVGPTNRHLPKAGIYVSNLRGEAYHQDGCLAGDFSPGATITLRREPDNPHDPFAVAVYDATGRHMAAYVNKQKARMLAKLMDAGVELHAVALVGTKARVPCQQVSILAAPPTVVAHVSSPRPEGLPTPVYLRSQA